MAEIFDNDLANYQRRLEREDNEALLSDTFDFIECMDWKLSNCCGAKIIYTDICSDCKEHAAACCDDCDHYYECDNENKVEKYK